MSPSDTAFQPEGTSVKGLRHYANRDKYHVSAIVAAPPPNRGTESILVVDDDEFVRRLICIVLRDSGYRVIEAANGVEAMMTCQCHQSPIHLVLSDIVMPQLGGLALAQRLGGHVPILLMSGHDMTSGSLPDAAVHPSDALRHHGILRKPFTPSGLIQKVREILDSVYAV